MLRRIYAIQVIHDHLQYRITVPETAGPAERFNLSQTFEKVTKAVLRQGLKLRMVQRSPPRPGDVGLAVQLTQRSGIARLSFAFNRPLAKVGIEPRGQSPTPSRRRDEDDGAGGDRRSVTLPSVRLRPNAQKSVRRSLDQRHLRKRIFGRKVPNIRLGTLNSGEPLFSRELTRL